MSFKIRNNNSGNMHQRFINNARQLNLTKSKAWLTKLFDKNKVCTLKSGNDFQLMDIGNTTDIATYKEQFFQMIDVFERKYDNNWDIQVDYSDSYNKYYFAFLINYDYLSITNTSGHQRDIYDLLVLLPVKWNKDEKATSVGVPKGTRLTLAEDEWKNGYYHSHLTKKGSLSDVNNLMRVDNFCIGSEDMSELVIAQQYAFDAGMFELMLYTLDNMVAWESLEGNPHFKMATIASNSSFTVPSGTGYPAESLYDNFSSSMRRMADRLFSDSIECNLNFAYSEGRFKIKQDADFIQYIKEHYLKDETIADNIKYVFCKLAPNNLVYYGYTQHQSRNAIDLLADKASLPFTYIQGTKHEFKIINIAEDKQEDINEYIIHPKFLNYVAEQLEIYIYESCIRSSSHNRLANTVDNVRRNSEPNQVFV